MNLRPKNGEARVFAFPDSDLANNKGGHQGPEL